MEEDMQSNTICNTGRLNMISRSTTWGVWGAAPMTVQPNKGRPWQPQRELARPARADTEWSLKTPAIERYREEE